MKTPSARVRFRTRIVLGYLAAFLVAVTWPGALPFNRFDPQVLGLPFNLAWPAAWVLAGFVLLLWLDGAVAAEEEDDGEVSG